jgi:arsenite-transporting ATPase
MAALTLVTGKGGVGKTTIASGLAEHLARDGRRVHLVQLEPPSGPEPELARRLLLDPRECVISVAGELLGSERLARFIARRDAVTPLMEAAEAVKAFAVLERIRPLMDEGPVVFDMPATGHALAWLRSVRLLRQVARRGKAHAMATRLEAALFGDGRTAVWAVTLPEPFVLQETEQLRRELSDLLPTRLVVNQLPERVPADARSDDARIQAELTRRRRQRAAVDVLDASLLTIPPSEPEPSAIARHLGWAA